MFVFFSARPSSRHQWHDGLASAQAQWAHVPEPPGSDPDQTPEIPPPLAPDEDIDLPPREDPAPIRDPEQPPQPS